MESVFNFYSIYDDVADIIAKEVHKGNQQEINQKINQKIKRLEIMNGFKSFVEDHYVMDYKDEFCEDEDDTITNLTDMLIEDFVYYKLDSKNISDEIILLGLSWLNDNNKKVKGVDYREKFLSSIYGYMNYLEEEETDFMNGVYDNFFKDMNEE